MARRSKSSRLSEPRHSAPTAALSSPDGASARKGSGAADGADGPGGKRNRIPGARTRPLPGSRPASLTALCRRSSLRGLAARRTELSPELAAHFNPQGHAWREVFGEAANEVFMTWRYAIFVNSVAEAGKREYPLPMYVNAQLPSLMERPGEYPSGGPHPYYLAVYRAMAPAIDFYAPDIYWPEFEYWVKRYRDPGKSDFHSGSEDRQRPLERAVCLRGRPERSAFALSASTVCSRRPIAAIPNRRS